MGEIGHLVQHGVNLRHNIFALERNGLAFGGAQGHVQDGALLGDVDLLSPEHGIDVRPQTGFLRQLQQE